MRLRLLSVLVLVGATFPAAPAHPACASAAAGTSRAGLVVEYPNAPAQLYCVSFTGSEITGLDLLRKTGLSIAYQDFGGGNVTVCSIGGNGCPYPKTPCFCHCATGGKTCAFWGYYTIPGAGGAWRFSQEGAGIAVVHNGEVNGWRWGAHGVQGARPPASTNLQKLCATGQHVSLAGTLKASASSTVPFALIAVVGLLVIGATLAFQRRKNEVSDG